MNNEQTVQAVTQNEIQIARINHIQGWYPYQITYKVNRTVRIVERFAPNAVQAREDWEVCMNDEFCGKKTSIISIARIVI